jgi:antirestriction protein ArdC
MNVYDIITERILKEIEKGTLPWHQPWKSVNGEEAQNLVSKKGYRGINRFLLSHLPYARPYYLTYKQAGDLGGTVKKGEHGTPVIFWKRNTYTKTASDGTQSEENGFMLRYYTVFNVEQCDGLRQSPPEIVPIEGQVIDTMAQAEDLVDAYAQRPTVTHIAQNRAYYQPSTDSIVLPERTQFVSSAEYYSTLFHELTHSTGHKTRLNRPTLVDASYFGSQNYSKEELVAEMGAAFLCGEAGIENEAALKNSASYLDGWRKKLHADSKLVIQAAAQAQKAADHILGKTWSE